MRGREGKENQYRINRAGCRFKNMKRSDITTKMVLECVRESAGVSLNCIELIMMYSDCTEKLAYRAMQRDAMNGLIDYGVMSIRYAWLTKKGEKLLKSLC